jgi:hypothetical protein
MMKIGFQVIIDENGISGYHCDDYEDYSHMGRGAISLVEVFGRTCYHHHRGKREKFT